MTEILFLVLFFSVSSIIIGHAIGYSKGISYNRNKINSALKEISNLQKKIHKRLEFMQKFDSLNDCKNDERIGDMLNKELECFCEVVKKVDNLSKNGDEEINNESQREV